MRGRECRSRGTTHEQATGFAGRCSTLLSNVAWREKARRGVRWPLQIMASDRIINIKRDETLILIFFK